MAMKLSVIVPFLNEAENIQPLTEAISAYCLARPHLRIEVLFVNDGSTDESVVKLRETVHRGYDARLISLSRNFGSHAALRAGIRLASGDRITFMYADLQDPIELIDRLIESSSRPGTISWGMRASTQSSFFERTFSRSYSALMRRFVSAHYPSNGFDVVMFDQKVQEILNTHQESHSSLFLQILTMGFRHVFISYDKTDRKRGKSKWTIGKKVKLLVDSFVAFSYAPIRFVTIVGVSMFITGMLWTIYIVLRKLIADDLSEGWPAMVSILTLGFGLTNISLGIIAEYLWRSLDASRRRPVYIIEEESQLTSVE